MDEVDFGAFNIVTHVGADTEDFVRGFAGLTSILTNFRTVVALASTALTSLAAVAMVHAIEKAAEFQTQMVKITTLTNEHVSDLKDLSSGVLEISTRLGIGAMELSQGLYTITSAGITGAKALDLLEQSAKASLIGMGDVNEIARVAAAAMQAWQKESLSSTDAIEIMLEGVRQGSIEADEYGNSLARVIGIAAQMGVSFEEVNAFVATFSRLGAGADVATTALRAALVAILSPGAQARETFDEIGISIDDMRQKIKEDGLTMAFIEMMEASQGNLDVLGKLLPNVRALSGVLGTAGVAAETYKDVTEAINTRQRDMNDTFEEYSKTFKAQMKELKAEMEAFVISLGNMVLPFGTWALDAANNWIDKIKEIGRETRILANMLQGDIDWAAGWKAVVGGAGGERAILRDPDAATRNEAIGQIEDKDYDTLAKWKSLLEERIFKDEYNYVNANTIKNIRTASIFLEEVKKKMEEIEKTSNKPLEGVTGIFGHTKEEREEIEKIIDKLHEKVEVLKGNERQLLINDLATQNATKSEREHALALFDQVEALEAAEKAKKELTAEMERRRKEIERENKEMREESDRIRHQASDREFAQQMENIRSAQAIELAMMEQDLERLADIAKSASDAIVSNLMSVVQGTKGVGPAFRDMVTSILTEVARLKLEQAIIGPLLNALMPVPSTPGALTLPSDYMDKISAIIPSGNSLMAPSSSQIIVQPSITYAPSMIDAQSGAQFIEQHGAKIADITVQTIQRSVALGRSMGG